MILTYLISIPPLLEQYYHISSRPLSTFINVMLAAGVISTALSSFLPCGILMFSHDASLGRLGCGIFSDILRIERDLCV